MGEQDITDQSIKTYPMKANHYYIYFTCEPCGNVFHIQAHECVQMDIVGAWRFKCMDCGNITEWISGNIKGIEGV